MAILFTVAVAVVLIMTGDFAPLADTTVLLLLLVFATVNVSVLVLRREPVEHEHFRAPTRAPVIGAVVCLILASPLTGRESEIYLRAAILLGIGIVLWFVNRLVVGRVDDFDPAAITK